MEPVTEYALGLYYGIVVGALLRLWRLGVQMNSLDATDVVFNLFALDRRNIRFARGGGKRVELVMLAFAEEVVSDTGHRTGNIVNYNNA